MQRRWIMATVGIRSLLRLAVALALIGGLVALAWRTTATDARARAAALEREQAELEQRNAALAQQNDRMRKRVEALRTDPRMMEKLARQTHHLVPDGSWVYLFP